jgi:hypothetical protein
VIEQEPGIAQKRNNLNAELPETVLKKSVAGIVNMHTRSSGKELPGGGSGGGAAHNS